MRKKFSTTPVLRGNPHLKKSQVFVGVFVDQIHERLSNVRMYIPPGIHMRHDVAICILGAEYMRTFDKRS